MNILAILLICILSATECSAQGKKMNFAKIKEYSPVNYEIKNDTNYYLSSIYWEGDRNNLYYFKKVEFNPRGETISYHLSCDLNLGFINLFWNAYHGSFGIEYTLSDSIKGTFNEISFEFESDSLKSHSLKIEFDEESKTTHFYELDQSLIEYYKNWLKGDAKDETTFEVPVFFDFSKLPLEKIQRFYSNSSTNGDTILHTQYFIDSSFQNNRVSRDSILIRQGKTFKIQKGNETISYLARILPESIEIEAYTYDSILQTTNQRMLKLLRNDTLYDIQLNTRLEGSQFISDYFVKGNHPVETYLNPYRKYRLYPNLKLDQLNQRKIHIARDSTGMIISGNAIGISSQGDTLKSVLLLYPIGINIDYGIGIVENKEPKIIECRENTKKEQKDYDIISLYPNLDLKPITQIRLINEYAEIGGATFFHPQPQKSKKIKSGYRNKKSPTYKQSIWRKTKKLKSTDRKVKIRKEEDYNRYIIYEFHYM